MAKETLLTLSARRSHKDGLTLLIKAHPALEEFIKAKSFDSATTAAGLFSTLDPNGPTLSLYDGFSDITINDSTGCYYGYTQRRSWLIDGSACNLSFLRIPGISSPEGVRVKVNGIFPLETVQLWLERASELARMFYRTHVAQFELTVSTTIERSTFIEVN